MDTRKPIIEPEKSTAPRLLTASFNQDSSCFTLGYDTGFRVYNTDPMDMKVKREFGDDEENTGAGIGIVRMLYRTNYLALVGGGKNPHFPLNKVIIWNDLKVKDALNLNFFSPVLNVFLSRTRIVVVLESKIYVHSFASPPKNISTFETCENPLGIAALSPGSYQSQVPNSQILAFPARVEGQIQIVDISSNGKERNLVSIIKAHKSKIRCIALNKSGTMIASASETGTIIRVYSTQTCSLLYEFRRGLDRAVVYSMEFSQNGSKLAVLSDKQTLHVYNTSGSQQQVNKHHMLKNLPVPLKPNYFNSTWSFCSIHLKDDDNDHISDDRGVLGWSGENSIIILWKGRAKWEKYNIQEKTSMNDDPTKRFVIVKDSWRSFNDL
jgi:WD40 repeat protein